MIISVASGKGGTGKTLVATSLALSLMDNNKVQLLDCDVEAPNDHLFIKPVITNRQAVCIEIPKVDYNRCSFCGECASVCVYKAIAVVAKSVLVFDQLCHGCGACSYLCPEKAISEQGREIGIVESGHADSIGFVQGSLTVGEAMPTPVIRTVKAQIDDTAMAILDVSPGTSCPVVESVRDSDYCILVTEPTPFGLHDLELAIDTVRQLRIPCGVIVNRTISAENLVQDYCTRKNITVLLEIPLDREIARLYSNGKTLAEGMPKWKMKFQDVYSRIKGALHERSRCA